MEIMQAQEIVENIVNMTKKNKDIDLDNILNPVFETYDQYNYLDLEWFDAIEGKLFWDKEDVKKVSDAMIESLREEGVTVLVYFKKFIVALIKHNKKEKKFSEMVLSNVKNEITKMNNKLFWEIVK